MTRFALSFVSRRRALLLAGVFACASVGPALAQSSIRGRVVEPAGDVPVADAEVFIPRLNVTTRSDSLGRFVLAGLPDGRHQLRAVRVGYHGAEETVDLPAGGELVIRLRPDPQRVGGVEATAATVPARMREFEQRRANSRGGRFLTRADLQAHEQRRFADVVRELPGLRLVQTGGNLFAASSRGQGPRALTQSRPCFTQLYLDGSQLFSDDGSSEPPNLSEFVVANIEAVEYYPTAGATPAQLRGTGAQCGTLVLWTRIGR